MNDASAERMHAKRVGEIMVPLDKYPHVSAQSTLEEAIRTMETAQIEVAGRRSLPRLLLVADEDNQVLGIVRRRDLLRGLEPRFLTGKPPTGGERLFDMEVDPNLLDFNPGRLVEDMRRRARRSIRDVMTTDVVTIDHEDSIMKAIHKIVQNDVTCLPVMKDDRVIGVVRTVELFHEVAQLLL
jgi:CBS domain-containing protein